MKRVLFAVLPAVFAMGCSGDPSYGADSALGETSQNAEIVQVPDDVYLPLDPCRTAEPDKLYYVLQNSAPMNAESGSGGYGYRTTACKRWVVDYKVATYSPEWIISGEAWDLPSSSVANGTWPSNAQDCARVATYLTFYRKKASETAFTQIGSGKITGQWSASSSTCYRVPTGMTSAIAPHSVSGWDTWRVAVGTKLRTTWQEVRATGQQYFAPPS
jgi:hypothetical protein